MLWSALISIGAYLLRPMHEAQGPLGAAQGVITPALSEYAEHLLSVFKVPGMSLIVVRQPEDKVTEFGTWGIRSEGGEATSVDTLYEIASNSKAFLAASLGILIDDFANGRNVTCLPPGVESFDWDSKVQDLLPGEWELQDKWMEFKVSLMDMLSHVTGMPRHDFSNAPEDSLSQIVQRMKHLRPAHELRKTFDYTNQMYSIVSYIISRYSKQSYPSFVKERIFTPLEMTSSTFAPQEAHNSGRLADTFTNKAGVHRNETRRIPFFSQGWGENGVLVQAGPGGIISSPRDMAKWLQTLLNGGVYKGTRIISESSLRVTMTGNSVLSGTARFPELSAEVYGAGWHRSSYQGHEMVFHSGGDPGFSSFIALFPADGLAIGMMSNADSVHAALMSLASRVAEDVLDLKRVDWEGRYKSLEESQSTAAQVAQDATMPGKMETPLSVFGGTYCNPGYGCFTLCTWPATAGNECESVLSDYRTVDPTFATSAATTIYAAWPRVWASHFRLLHQTGSVFKITFETLFTEGCGADKSPFLVPSLDDLGVVEFLLKDGRSVGVGMWGILGGSAKRTPGNPKETSDVWFERVVKTGIEE